MFQTRLLDGNYPETARLVNDTFNNIVKFNKDELVSVVESVSLLSPRDKDRDREGERGRAVSWLWGVRCWMVRDGLVVEDLLVGPQIVHCQFVRRVLLYQFCHQLVFPRWYQLVVLLQAHLS